jgi:DNA ligase-1
MRFEDTLMHGQDWFGDDVQGWHATEKLDGCRARWTGSELVSRSGRPINAPASVLRGLPDFPLDIEVYAGRTGRTHAGRAVQWGRWHESVHLVVFDAPTMRGDLPARLAAVRERCPGLAIVPELGSVGGLHDLARMLDSVQSGGGEGLMLHRPGAVYQADRVPDLLKVKSAYDLRQALEGRLA